MNRLLKFCEKKLPFWQIESIYTDKTDALFQFYFRPSSTSVLRLNYVNNSFNHVCIKVKLCQASELHFWCLLRAGVLMHQNCTLMRWNTCIKMLFSQFSLIPLIANEVTYCKILFQSFDLLTKGKIFCSVHMPKFSSKSK